MELFRKRENATQNIAYMAIMSAINVIFILLSNLLPVLLFLLVLILPLTSTIVTLYCKKKYYPVYALVTLGLCFAVAGGFSIFDALIYVFPSMIVGFLFGISFEHRVSAILIIVGTTTAQFLLTYLTYFILTKIIDNFDVMMGLIKLFGLSDFKYLHAFLLIFLFIISQIQIVLSYLFIKLEIHKFGIEVNLECHYRYILYLSTLLTIGLAVLSYFYFPNWCLVFVMMPLPIYIYETLQLILKRKKLNYVLLVIFHLAFIFIFAFLYQYVSSPNQLILITTILGLVTIIDFLDNYCFIKNTNKLK